MRDSEKDMRERERDDGRGIRGGKAAPSDMIRRVFM